jgi:hypothetical protein
MTSGIWTATMTREEAEKLADDMTAFSLEMAKGMYEERTGLRFEDRPPSYVA